MPPPPPPSLGPPPPPGGYKKPPKGSERGALLRQINKGTKLEKTVTNDRSVIHQFQVDQLSLCQRAGAVRKFKPLFDRILIEKFLPEIRTKGGVLLPEKSQAKVLEGTVVAVGPGTKDRDGKDVPVSVNIGDKVLLPEFGGTKINLEEKEYHIYRDGDILGKFED